MPNHAAAYDRLLSETQMQLTLHLNPYSPIHKTKHQNGSQAKVKKDYWVLLEYWLLFTGWILKKQEIEQKTKGLERVGKRQEKLQ